MSIGPGGPHREPVGHDISFAGEGGRLPLGSTCSLDDDASPSPCPDPTLDAAQVREALEQSARADDFTGAVPNARWGYGKVDAYAAALRVQRGTPTEPEAEASGLGLSAAPNPVAGTATVMISLDAPGRVTVALFDVLGREVAGLHDGPLGTGSHPFALDTSRLPAGVYLIRARTPGAVQATRVVVAR